MKYSPYPAVNLRVLLLVIVVAGFSGIFFRQIVRKSEAWGADTARILAENNIEYTRGRTEDVQDDWN